MKILPGLEHPIYARLQSAQQVLVEQCTRFVGLHNGKALSAEHAEALLATLASNDGLPAFACALRNHIQPGRFNTAPFWHMIDSIWFWVDAHPASWPYTQDSDWKRYLGWSRESAEEALSVTTH